MSHVRRSIAWTAALCLAIAPLAASAADAPEKPAAPDAPKATPAKSTPDKPTTGKPAAPNLKPIPAAIAALRDEYKAYTKDAKNALRDKCDYFKENPAEVTPAEIVKALDTNITGDPALQAYVKWQLLSGIPSKFPEELEKKVLAVYYRAPEPADHPGLDHRYLTKVAGGVRGDEAAAVQKKFDEMLEKNTEYNHPILAFRDELYARLPSNKPEVFVAGFGDVHVRSSHGMPATGIFDSISGSIRSWAIIDAKPGQAKSLASEVSRLKDSVTKADKPFGKLTADAKTAKWGPDATAGVAPAKFDELLKFLTENSSPANGGGLKFKDK